MDAAARRMIDTAVEGILDQVAADVARDAQRFVPVDTGDLRASVHVEKVDAHTVRVVADAANEDGKSYAAAVENGTSRMAAQPYLRPSLYRARGLG